MKTIIISSANQHKSINTNILLGIEELPVCLVIKGKESKITKSKGKYYTSMEGFPYAIPFNKLSNLLKSIYTTNWEPPYDINTAHIPTPEEEREIQRYVEEESGAYDCPPQPLVEDIDWEKAE